MTDPWSLDGPSDEIIAEASRLRVRREAQRIVDAEAAADGWSAPDDTIPSLADQLSLPEEGEVWTLGGLLPAGGNVVLAAVAKAGKTTMMNNLIRSLCDGDDFLACFPVASSGGRVGMWNYEVGQGQYLRWMRDAGIRNPGNVSELHLRGRSVPLQSAIGRDWAIDWLSREKVSTWIIDPFARAASGIQEDKAHEVGPWLEAVDEIKESAGVREVILVTHTPKPSKSTSGEIIVGGETARGSQRLHDWPDVAWYISRDSKGQRMFRASGRDVEIGASSLLFDDRSRSLFLDSRPWLARRGQQ